MIKTYGNLALNENDPCLHWRFRNDLRLHYTTENACHVTIHTGTIICIGIVPII